MLFRINSFALTVVVVALVGGATVGGIATGRFIEERRGTTKESVGAAQGALLGFVGLLLAFGMTMAVSRYESRRVAVVDESNAIGTTYLRAQTLAEPERSQSLTLLRQYTDSRLALSAAVPNTVAFRKAIGTSGTIQNQIWALAGAALAKDPTGSATRLYVDSLNDMIDMDTVRVATLTNRVPVTVVYLQLLGGAFAVGLLAMYLAMLGRSVITGILAAAMVCLILLAILDLDRPIRGVVNVPSTPLAALRLEMEQPPAAAARPPR